MINKKMLMTCFAILFFSAVFYQTSILATATTYPSYNSEVDCRNCHGITVDRHHLLVANGTHQCTDCHAMKYDSQNQTYYPEVIRNCLICHPGKDHTDIHHLLVAQGLFVCSDCHQMKYDSQNQTYYPEVTWDCTVCHSTVLRLNDTPPPMPTPTPPNPPTVANFSPLSPVNDIIGATRKFDISIDQVVDLTWYIDDSPVQSNNGVTYASYTNTSADLGIWNVSAKASNINGNVSFTWTWNVTVLPPPPTITSFAPVSPVNNTIGSSRKFGITIDQIADIIWYINGNPVQSNDSVMGASYNNTNASIGTWNVRAVATNANGSVTYYWTWNVVALPPPPVITSYSPISPVNDSEGTPRTFSITIDQIADIIWYINGNPVQYNNGVTVAGYTNTSVSGTWNVSAKASNINGEGTHSWIWNVSPNPKPITTIDPPNGQNGWYVTNTIYLNATDNNSIKCTNYSIDGGIWNSNPGSGLILKTPINLSDGNHTIQYYSVDNLNGIEFTNTQTVKIDKTPPLITINSPVNGSIYILNQNLIANWFVSDGISGIATAIGTYPNGSVINTTSAGTKNFSVYATDKAGNTNTKNVTYYIRYNFGQFLEPINNDGSSIFKLGSTIPIKFQLTDANGNYVNNAVARLNLSKITPTVTGTYWEAYTTGSGTNGDVFIYETNGNKYSYNLVTKNMSIGTWRIRVNINDGSSYAVNISLKK